MGNDPGEFEFGAACTICVGIVFEDGETPQYIALEFWGITKLCPALPDPPNGHRFICKLVEYCYWLATGTIDGFDYEVWLDLEFGSDSRASGFFWPTHDYFFESIPPDNCILEGESDLPIPGDPLRECYAGGSYKVDWGSGINKDAFDEQS